MGTKINSILGKPLFIGLYGISFIVFKASAYLASFRWLPALYCLVLYGFFSYLFFLVFKKLTNHLYAGIPVILLWASLLHIAGMAQVFGFSYSHIPVRFYIVFYIFVVLLLFVVCRLLLKVPGRFAASFNPVANVFIVCCSVVFLLNGIQQFNKGNVRIKKHFHTQAGPHNNNLDIVWILMDEYASSECLSKQFAFHNPLDSILQQKHFTLLPSIRSRFPYTMFSVNSIFNRDDSITPASFYEAADLLRYGSLIPALERSGYRFLNLGFFDMAQHPMVADRSGYPYQYTLQLISGTLFYMVYNKWKSSIENCDAYNNDVLKKLDDALFHPSAGPRFIWAHILVPHEPFCRDKNGHLQKDSGFTLNDSAFIKRKYIDYLGYGNTVIASLLDRHPELAKKIVIISGDHGPRFPFSRQYQNSPFAAVFIPQTHDRIQLSKLVYISQIPDFLIRNVLINSDNKGQ